MNTKDNHQKNRNKKSSLHYFIFSYSRRRIFLHILVIVNKFVYLNLNDYNNITFNSYNKLIILF